MARRLAALEPFMATRNHSVSGLADARFVGPLGRCTTSTFATFLAVRLAKPETE
jgi:hypothetical protein